MQWQTRYVSVPQFSGKSRSDSSGSKMRFNRTLRSSLHTFLG
jgi:hypothetical protein